MKKAFLKVFAVILSLLVCAGTFSTARAEDMITLTVWSFTNEFQGILETYYVPGHPEIDFNFQIYPTSTYENRLDTMFSENPTAADAPDLFTLEAAFVKKYVNGNNTGDLGDVGITGDDLSASFESTLQVGRNPAGVQKGVSWQSVPGALFYRAFLAERYLGVTTPEQFQQKVRDWDAFLATARELKEASNGACRMVTGTDDIWQVYQYYRSQGWVSGNTVSIDSSLIEYENLCKALVEDDLTRESRSWTEAWYAGMNGTVETLCYFFPTWGLEYTLKPNCGQDMDYYSLSEEERAEFNVENGTGTYGDWRMTVGPNSFIWGGTWVATNAAKVNAASAAKKAAIKDLLCFLAVDENFQTSVSENPASLGNSGDVIDNILENGGKPDPFLGGQDPLDIFALSADMTNGDLQTEYDSDFTDLWNIYVTGPYTRGEDDLETCLENFRREVAARYPELRFSDGEGDEKCGPDLTWELDDKGVLTVSGTGEMYDFEDIAPWYDSRDQITSVVIGDGVTSVGNYAFYYFYDGLKSVTMADTVTRIGNSAFQYCQALTEVRLSSGVTEIGDTAFAQDPLLTSVTLPDGLKTLGTAVFAETGLTGVNVPAGTQTVVHDFFCPGPDYKPSLYHVALPASVTDDGYGTFAYCPLPSDLPDFILPGDLKTIEAEAFSETDVRFVWIPDGTVGIGEGAFAGSASLRYVYIPYDCETIAPDAFPDSVKILGISGEQSAPQAYANDYSYEFIDLEDPFGGNG